MNEKIIIFIDILGFVERAREIENALNIPAKKIRKDFLDTINEKIEQLKENKIIVTFTYGQRDDWLLIVNSVDQAFQAINGLFDHNVFYPKFEKIPLEIALGTGEFDQWVKFDNDNLSVEDDMILFLKTNIIGDYHKWYKSNNDNNSPHDTFIVLTESFFSLLEFSEKNSCQKNSINEKILYSIPLEKINEKSQITSFLNEIGYPKHTRYRMINELFVPPFEFLEMEKTLENEKILLIIGTQEHGKTFSAVKLLWDYYQKGYKPKWIRGGEDLERSACRTILENISGVLTPKTIVYFEDPFGKIVYEKRESLEREIGTIIQEIQRMNDVYVIITSREEVFKQFESELIQLDPLKQLKLIFSIKNDSYDHSKRVKILINWANFQSCKWLKDENAKNHIIDALREKSKLPTPLAIWNFAIASANLTYITEIIPVLEEKSQETSIAFAKEIEKMSQDKIIFLTFPFIADFSKELVNKKYNDLIEQIHLEKSWKFDPLLKWFANDKIDVVKGAISFSHPSYWESFKTIIENEKRVKNDPVTNTIIVVFNYLVDNGGAPAGGVAKFISENPNIFSEELKISLLKKLSENNHAKKWVAKTIIENYSTLPPDLQNKIFQLAATEDAKTVRLISDAVSETFNKLPQPLTHNLLLVLISNKNSISAIARILKEHFNEIPSDLRNQLIFKMAENPTSVNYVPEIIAEYYDLSTPEIRSLFFRLSESPNTSGSVAEAIINNYNKLPQNVKKLLFILSKNPYSTHNVAESIVFNYETLDQNVKNLLTLYAIDRRTAGTVAIAVINNYDRLPKNIKNLLFSISREDTIIENLIEPIGNNYGRLPKDIQKILFDLTKKPDLVGRIAKTVGENFDKIPETERNELLLELATKHHSATRIAKILDNHFNEIPFKVALQLMNLLAKDDISSAYVSGILNEKFRLIPIKFSIELLDILSSQKNPSKDVAEIIFKNYHYFPEEIKNVNYKLADNEASANNVAIALSNEYSKIPENVSLELLMKLANHESAAHGVAKIIDFNFNKIPEKNRNQILIKMSENLPMATVLPEIISHHYNLLPNNIRILLFHLAQNDAVARFVVTSIAFNFSSLPDDVRNLLVSLSSKKCTANAILKMIDINFYKFPEDFRYNLLITASKNENIASEIAYVLLKNYLSLDAKTKEILFELVKDEAIAIKIASAIMKNFDSMPKEIKKLNAEIMKNINLNKFEDIHSQDL